MDLQVQMTDDYPLNSDDKGKCDYVTAGKDKWVYCTNPHAELKTWVTTDFSSSAQSVTTAWGDFSGGNPVSSLDCKQLLGIQMQLNCPSDAACSPNFTIDDLTFY